MNDNPKNNILMLENIRQKRLAILEYFLKDTPKAFDDFKNKQKSVGRKYVKSGYWLLARFWQFLMNVI